MRLVRLLVPPARFPTAVFVLAALALVPACVSAAYFAVLIKEINLSKSSAPVRFIVGAVVALFLWLVALRVLHWVVERRMSRGRIGTALFWLAGVGGTALSGGLLVMGLVALMEPSEGFDFVQHILAVLLGSVTLSVSLLAIGCAVRPRADERQPEWRAITVIDDYDTRYSACACPWTGARPMEAPTRRARAQCTDRARSGGRGVTARKDIE